MNLNDSGLFKQQAYINGNWISARDTLPVNNPATGKVIARIPMLSASDVQSAIKAAENAFIEWRAKTAAERSGLLRKWYQLILDNQEDLAILMTAEQGKPLSESRGEVAYGASYVEWYAEEAKRAYGDLIPATKSSQRIMVTREPVGVVAAITPWNFPNAMITRKVAPALAAGCTIIIKPSELTPLSAFALAELAERAGIPAGVINVVTRDAKAIGSELTSSSTIRKLSFTGSTAVGKLLMKQCADSVKKISLELGGNAPFIVFDDANIDQAVQGAIASKYRNSGQTCVCMNRLFVQDGIYDEFVEKFSGAVSRLTVGSATDGDFDLGPLINEAALLKIRSIVDDALAKKARLLTGGRPHNLGGLFYEPTVLTDASIEMKCYKEEVFGPIAPVFRFQYEEDVVKMANDTQYGLAAYFYANDISRVLRVAEALEYGMVAVNEGVLSTEVAPFGGIKESGIGREGSKYGLDEYLEMKYLLLGGISAS
ncbi:NAD-dependent succinate-semialdehyde dehydrogenase [Endozoicomonas sp. 8E]|uniref:NAD-dependent succinate-semialdehyde dehydrogenase n=1 Tax=Endozoicomonas sp. 8E TaxID=3035692 RepID=UPI00293923BD|nr:NAD-dependent succinate-semialdehyde dehydrogenase [Endozoicomonas sp. 8E]WOG28711.1 NAD-dependent succinate-semialdehyde dehydrogenase [Endozoicomonas sp. 8E]